MKNKQKAPDSSVVSLKSILKGAGLFFVGMVIGKAAFYLFRLIVARLGTAEYGTFSLAVSVFDIIAMISFLGVTTAILRFIPEARAKADNGRIKDLIFSAFRISITASAVLAFFLYLSSGFISIRIFSNPGLEPLLVLMAVAIPFYSAGGVATTVLRSYGKMEFEVFTKFIVENAVKLLLAALFISMGLGVFGVTVAFVVSILSTFVLALYFMQTRAVRFFSRRMSFSGLEQPLLRYSLPLMLSSIVYVIIAWADVLILGAFKPASEVGLYSAALPTAGLLLLLPMALNSLFLPVIAQLLSLKKKAEFSTVYYTLSKWIFFGNFGIFLMFFFFGRQVLRVLFTQPYEAAGLALQILAAGHLFYSVFFNSSDVLGALNKPRLILKNTVISSAANVVINLLLIPPLGFVGAAIGTSASYLLLGGLNAYEVHRLTGAMPFSKAIYKPILGGSASLLAAFSVFRLLHFPSADLYLFALSIAYGFLYLLSLILLRSLDRTDFEILLAIERKAKLDLGFFKDIIRKYYRP